MVFYILFGNAVDRAFAFHAVDAGSKALLSAHVRSLSSTSFDLGLNEYFASYLKKIGQV